MLPSHSDSSIMATSKNIKLGVRRQFLSLLKNQKNLMPNIVQKIATELNLKPVQINTSVQLLDDDNTVPFIAR